MYLCPSCDEEFETPTFLTEHYKINHGTFQTACKCRYADCFRKFNTFYSYRSHITKTHLSVGREVSNDDLDTHFESTEYNLAAKKTQTHSPKNSIAISSSQLEAFAAEALISNISAPRDLASFNSLGDSIEVLEGTEATSNTQNPELCMYNPGSSSDSVNLDLEEFETLLSEKATAMVAKLYADNSISRSTVHTVLNSFKSFYADAIETLRQKHNLASCTDFENMNVMFDVIKDSFSEFNTEHMTLQTFAKSGHYIKPLSISINAQLKPRRVKKKTTLVTVSSSIEFVPMKPVLAKFLELPNAYASIITFMEDKNPDTIISSMLEAEVWQKIKQRYHDKIVLPLTLFCDDYEINNPLGTHRGKQKMGGVYYTISSIPCEFSSKLQNIFLAQIHKSTDYKELGNKKIFSRLIDELHDLETNGITVNVGGELKIVYFALARILGDNLGLNLMLGFTGSFNASYYCRVCRADKVTMHKMFRENESLLRTITNYANDVLECDHGVKEECTFNELDSYHVIECISVDPMHDLYEGICRYEMGEILHYCIIKKKMISIEALNSRIANLNIDLATGTNVSPSISIDAVKNKFLILSAAEMSFLVLHFGIILGDLFAESDEVWALYILLRKIVRVVMGSSFNDASIELLNDLIYRHHELYFKLFGKLKPKHHFLLHYPRAMRKLGPLRYVSSMIYEGKHKKFKNTAKVVRSRVNAAHTLAVKHQLELSARFFENKPLKHQSVFGVERLVTLNSLREYQNFRSALPEDLPDKVQSLSWVSFDGTKYKTETLVCMKGDDDLPHFGRIRLIIHANNSVHFIVNEMKTVALVNHIQAYEIEATSRWLYVTKQDFYVHDSFNIQVLPSGKKVVLCT